MSNDDKTKKESIKQRQEQLNIPDYIFDIYKVISRQDKMDVYENICKFTTSDHAAVQDLIQRLSYSMSIEWNGFEIVLNSIKQTIRNKNLSNLIEQKTNSGKGPNSILTVKVSSYLERGFKGLIEFDTQKRNPPFDIDRAMSETTRFVYDTLKYQLVKHLGVFNIMYKFYLSRSEGKNFDDIAGIDRLLTKLEYNALSDIGRRASDYGVPDKILRYYEENDKGSAASIKQQFDSYENMVFERVNYMMGDKN